MKTFIFKFFWPNIISNGLYQTIRNNIVAKKTTELVLLFHKNITELVFLWSNMSQKCFKILIKEIDYMNNNIKKEY